MVAGSTNACGATADGSGDVARASDCATAPVAVELADARTVKVKSLGAEGMTRALMPWRDGYTPTPTEISDLVAPCLPGLTCAEVDDLPLGAVLEVLKAACQAAVEAMRQQPKGIP